MQFRIAPRQIDQVTIGRGFIGKGREKADFGPGPMPIVQQVRIGKGKGDVAGNGNALGWGHRFDGISPNRRGRRRKCQYRIDVQRRGRQMARAGQKRIQIGAFFGLNQPQMPRGLGKVGLAVKRTQDLQSGGGKRVPQHRFMPGRAHLVQDHSFDAQAIVMA